MRESLSLCSILRLMKNSEQNKHPVFDSLGYMYALERFGIEPGLSRMEEMMELLGHPERNFKAMHISGTNGKGSVAAMLDSILRQTTRPELFPFDQVRDSGEAVTIERNKASNVELLANREIEPKHVSPRRDSEAVHILRRGRNVAANEEIGQTEGAAAGNLRLRRDSTAASGKALKVGLYTSPHLYRFNERIQVDGEEILDKDLARHVEVLRELVEKHEIQATFFEFTTAVAISYFAERGVDVAIVEVGMGGLLDATNVVESLVSVITNIGLDHTEYLGDSKEKITIEKSGIIKDGAPIITAERDEKLLRIIKEKASEVESKVYEVGKLVSPTVHSPIEGDFLRSQKIAVKGIFKGEFDLPLLGAHQVENAATALSVLYVLNGQGFAVSWDAIGRGMSGVRWEGRLQVVARSPLVLVDGAHNNDGVEALYEFIKDMSRHDVLVLGEKKDKDMKKMTELIVPLFDRVVVTRGVYMAEETSVIAKELKESGYKGEIVEIEDAGEAVLFAKKGLDDDALVLVAGSLYMVAGALAGLREESRVDKKTA